MLSYLIQSFTYSFPILVALVDFSCLFILANIANTMINDSESSGYSSLVSTVNLEIECCHERQTSIY